MANFEPVEELDGRARWEELPVEVLELILANVKSRNQLLYCRFVSSLWESAATSVLRRRCQDISTRWDSSTDIEVGEEMSSASTPFPILTLVPKNSKHSGLSTAFYPRGSSPLPRGANPFFTNSLVLATTGMHNCGTFQNLAEKKRISIYNLLQRNGGCLTSLHIYGAVITPADLYKLLQQVPNLKAIQLVKIRFGEEENTDPSTLPLVPDSPVPKLTHAVFRVYSRTISHWLVSMLGPNLINLDFVCLDTVLAFNELNYLDPSGNGRKPFQKLKRLRIIGPSRDFILDTGVNLKMSLESLYMDHMWNEALSINEVIQFLERFARTLVDLRLNSGHMKDMGTVVTQQRKGNSITFSRLTRLTVGNCLTYDNLKRIKKYLLPRFPNLETLRLKGLESIIYVRPTTLVLRRNAWDFFQKEGLWELCGNLKIIEVPTSDYLTGKKVYTFTRQEREATRWEKQNLDSIIWMPLSPLEVKCEPEAPESPDLSLN